MATLKIIGCSDAFNSGGQRHTSFLLSHNDYQVLIDCGANTVLGFKQIQEDFAQLDYIIITHFHGDHYGGLPYLILEAATLQKRKKPLILISPPGLKERLYGLMELLYPSSKNALETFPIEYISFTSHLKMKLAFGDLTAYSVQHTPETMPHGIRLEMEDKVFAYSGDTGWNDNLIQLADGADLFVCECNFYTTATQTHLNYRELREKQILLKTKRLMLTHLGEEMLNNKKEIEIEILQEGQEIKF